MSVQTHIAGNKLNIRDEWMRTSWLQGLSESKESERKPKLSNKVHKIELLVK